MEIDKTSLTAGDIQTISAWDKLFASQGWILLKRRFNKRLDGNLADLESADTLVDLGLCRGSRQVLIELVNLDVVLENEFNGLIADAQADRQDVEESEGGW